MPTTLLSLVGASGRIGPMLGYDLTKAEDPNRALIQFDKNSLCLYKKYDRVAILQQSQEAKGYTYHPQSMNLFRRIFRQK